MKDNPRRMKSSVAHPGLELSWGRGGVLLSCVAGFSSFCDFFCFSQNEGASPPTPPPARPLDPSLVASISFQFAHSLVLTPVLLTTAGQSYMRNPHCNLLPAKFFLCLRGIVQRQNRNNTFICLNNAIKEKSIGSQP